MMTIITILLIILIILLVLFVFFYIKKLKQDENNLIKMHKELLERKGIFAKKIIHVNKKLTIALNKSATILTYIENIDNENKFKSNEILTKFITKIEKINKTIKIHYTKQGEKNTLVIYPFNKETEDIVYKIYKNTCISKIKDKYKQGNFTITSASDWNCSYVWAFDSSNADFIYYKTADKPVIYKINLKREVFTLDTKYNYFEAPLLGKRQQLFIYEPNFLKQMYNSFVQYLKAKTVKAAEDLIYYNNYSNFVYILNDNGLIQSVDLDNIEDVYYSQNRIFFTRYDDEKSIKVIADDELIKEFEDFVMGYNLNKISQSFDYNYDKLINATPYTKFIIDFTKKRCIYCANLDSFSKFTYITIAFNNLAYISVERTGQLPFVRITTHDGETIDVSCNKIEVADYISAQLRLILMK